MTAALHDLAVLARLRLTLWRRPRTTSRTGRGGRSFPKRRLIIFGVLLVVLGFLAFNLAGFLGALASMPEGRALLGSLLVWLSLSASLLLFLAAIPAVLAQFTYASDLRLLLLTPISPRLLMADKILSACAGYVALMAVFGIPIMVAIGHGAGLGLGFDLVAILLVILFPLGPVSLAALLLVLVLRWIPPARARTVTAIFGMLLGLSGYIANTLLSGRRGGAAFQGMLAATPHSWWQSLPPAWPGQALSALTNGQAAAALGYVVGSLVLWALLAALAVLVSARLFATGWATYQEVGRRPRTAALAPAPAVPASPRPIGQPARPAPSALVGRLPAWWPLIGKEWRSLRRDPQVWARLLYSLVVAGFGLYRVVSGQSFAGTSGLSGVTFFGALAFFVYLLQTSLAAPIVNREGRAFVLLRMSPLSARDVLLAKWAFCAVPAVVIIEVLVCAGSILLRLAAWRALLAGAALGGLAVALAGGFILVNLIWPRLDWDNPRRQLSTTGSLVGSFGGLLFAGVVFGLLMLTFALASSQQTLAVLAVCGLAVLLTGTIALVALFAPRLLGALMAGERGATV